MYDNRYLNSCIYEYTQSLKLGCKNKFSKTRKISKSPPSLFYNTTEKKMSGIEQIAKSWLSDPPWQKVFKHTVDVVEDYISYILVCM